MNTLCSMPLVGVSDGEFWIRWTYKSRFTFEAAFHRSAIDDDMSPQIVRYGAQSIRLCFCMQSNNAILASM